ncbi:MAG TPA: universal stress protein, partial [Anaerolineales bacterium]|nr:universal stress protein [Anaerolineales bacterium]
LGNGMASVQVRTDPAPAPAAIARAIRQNPVDLVIVGWRPVEGVNLAEQILQLGDHHLLLAARPEARLEKALVCAASGEPGKDDVMFAGRLLRHVGAQAKLLTVGNAVYDTEHQRHHIDRFLAGGKQSLERFGVPTEIEIRIGHPETQIVEEIQKGDFDLVVLGAPMPDRGGRVSITRVVEGVMKNAGNCSVLIVRSHSYRI